MDRINSRLRLDTVQPLLIQTNQQGLLVSDCVDDCIKEALPGETVAQARAPDYLALHTLSVVLARPLHTHQETLNHSRFIAANTGNETKTVPTPIGYEAIHPAKAVVEQLLEQATVWSMMKKPLNHPAIKITIPKRMIG